MLRNHLVRMDYRPPQTLVDVHDREKNIKGAFGVKNGNEIKGKTLLLIDDVYTTGATLKECSKILIRAGAKEIRAISVAQA